MLTGVSLLCFTASYGVALLLEASRLLFRAPVRFIVMVLFTIAGLIAHTIYLAMQAQAGMPGGMPLSSWYEWCLLGAWVLAATYLGLLIRRPESAIGIFLLPLVEGLIGVAYWLKDSPPFQRSEALQNWGMLHGVSLLLGTVAVTLGFVAGLMYLVQSYRLKHKLPPRAGFKLPSLEWLQRFSERSLVISSLLLLAGIASGAVFNIIKQRPGLAWSDPVVVMSGGLCLWLIAALLFNGFYRPARQGRKVAYLTVASFVVVMLVLSIVWSSSNHAQAAQEVGSREWGVGSKEVIAMTASLPGRGRRAAAGEGRSFLLLVANNHHHTVSPSSRLRPPSPGGRRATATSLLLPTPHSLLPTSLPHGASS